MYTQHVYNDWAARLLETSGPGRKKAGRVGYNDNDHNDNSILATTTTTNNNNNNNDNDDNDNDNDNNERPGAAAPGPRAHWAVSVFVDVCLCPRWCHCWGECACVRVYMFRAPLYMCTCTKSGWPLLALFTAFDGESLYSNGSLLRSRTAWHADQESLSLYFWDTPYGLHIS